MVVFRIWLRKIIRPANSTSIFRLCMVHITKSFSFLSTTLHLPSPNVVVVPSDAICTYVEKLDLVSGIQYAVQKTVFGPVTSSFAIPRLLEGTDIPYSCSIVTGVSYSSYVKCNSSLRSSSLAPLSTIMYCWSPRLFYDSVSHTVTIVCLPLLVIFILRFSNLSFLVLDLYPVDLSSHCIRLCAVCYLLGRLQPEEKARSFASEPPHRQPSPDAPNVSSRTGWPFCHSRSVTIVIQGYHFARCVG